MMRAPAGAAVVAVAVTHSPAGIRQSMGRAGCALDNAAAESFFSTLQHERLSRRRYPTRLEARRDVAAWIDQWYNRRRRHSSAGMLAPIEYEQANAAYTNPPKKGGKLSQIRPEPSVASAMGLCAGMSDDIPAAR